MPFIVVGLSFKPASEEKKVQMWQDTMDLTMVCPLKTRTANRIFERTFFLIVLKRSKPSSVIDHISLEPLISNFKLLFRIWKFILNKMQSPATVLMHFDMVSFLALYYYNKWKWTWKTSLRYKKCAQNQHRIPTNIFSYNNFSPILHIYCEINFWNIYILHLHIAYQLDCT